MNSEWAMVNNEAEKLIPGSSKKTKP